MNDLFFSTMNLIKATLDKLQKGDIYQTAEQPESGFTMRFHSYSFYSDSKREWHEEYREKSRLCVLTIPFGYNGPIEKAGCHAFQWQSDNDPAKINVWIVQEYKISNSSKHSGETYSEFRGNRQYVNFKVNPINYLPC